MATEVNLERGDSDSGSNIDDQESDGEFSGFESDEALFNAHVLGTVNINQAENDRKSPKDEQISWEINDSPPLNAPFSGVPGLTVDLPEDPTPLDFFYLMFDEAMWQRIVVQTNLYANNRHFR